MSQVNPSDSSGSGSGDAKDHAPSRVLLNRRTLIIGGGLIGLGLLSSGVALGRGFTGTMLPGATVAPSTAAPAKSPALRRFVSTELTVPAVRSWRRGPATAGFLFVSQRVKTFGGLIMEESGEPVWIEPTKANLTDLRVQSFEGKPVLTYWSGEIDSGHGAGVGTILDSSYATIATVRAGNGLDADLHEFTLTAAGTALLMTYTIAGADLSSVGGPVHGYVYDNHVQEVDVRTGNVLMDWSSLEHIDVAETYLDLEDRDGTTPGRAFDPYHLNSIAEDGTRLLLCFRHTHAVLSIDRITGEIQWRLGGKKSDIEVAQDAAFAWQHDARRRGDGTITLFDNHIHSGKTGQSRGMILDIDETAGIATLKQEFTYDRHLGTAMGNLQALPNGNILVGWGTDPAVTEFTPSGDPVYEAPLGGISYRALRQEWTAQPATRPALAVQSAGSNLRIFASWNGATEVSRWRIRAGDSESDLRAVATIPRSGFETSARIARAKKIAVDALDASGSILSTSLTVTA